jgi:hypothetical protein
VQIAAFGWGIIFSMMGAVLCFGKVVLDLACSISEPAMLAQSAFAVPAWSRRRYSRA